MIRILNSRSRDLNFNEAAQDRRDQLLEITDLESRLARVKGEIVGRIRAAPAPKLISTTERAPIA
jgi:hypothetical protein